MLNFRNDKITTFGEKVPERNRKSIHPNNKLGNNMKNLFAKHDSNSNSVNEIKSYKYNLNKNLSFL